MSNGFRPWISALLLVVTLAIGTAMKSIAFENSQHGYDYSLLEKRSSDATFVLVIGSFAVMNIIVGMIVKSIRASQKLPTVFTGIYRTLIGFNALVAAILLLSAVANVLLGPIGDTTTADIMNGTIIYLSALLMCGIVAALQIRQEAIEVRHA